MGFFKLWLTGASKRGGFSSIETLSSIMILSTISVGAMPQLPSLENEARSAVVQASLGALRTSLQLQKLQVMLRCQGSLTSTIHTEQLQNNDISAGALAPCSVSEIPTHQERRFMSEGMPVNPFKKNNLIASCKWKNDPCSSVDPHQPEAWCYDSAEEKVWANSNVAGECQF